MKRVLICLFLLLVASQAVAADCRSDRIVQRWLEERDRAAQHVVRTWARGAPLEEIAPGLAVMLSNEIYVCSKCRGQEDFLRENLILLGAGSEPKVETVPAIILERMLGTDLLSPWKQFPFAAKEEMVKR
ncbi:MAG TPA: hypothetical protein EYP17_04685 [Candidatus Latescibacteria bacterium]|nr:hypothetical protein [Candidatus Latescibacterota bacterium]